jgi:hypothetical protein
MATLDRVALAGEVGMVGNQLNRFEQAGKVGARADRGVRLPRLTDCVQARNYTPLFSPVKPLYSIKDKRDWPASGQSVGELGRGDRRTNEDRKRSDRPARTNLRRPLSRGREAPQLVPVIITFPPPSFLRIWISYDCLIMQSAEACWAGGTRRGRIRPIVAQTSDSSHDRDR